MKYRRFTPEFKRSVIEKLLSEAATSTELFRRYHISSVQLYTWKRHYADGKLDSEPSKEGELATYQAPCASFWMVYTNHGIPPGL